MVYTTLDIVLPCYNPPPGWETRAIEVYKFFCRKLPEVQIGLIIVNDHSPSDVSDAISAIAKAIPFLTVETNAANRGKGFTLRSGVAKSNAEICIYTDVDFPYTAESMLGIWNLLATGQADIAAGVKNAAYYNTVPAIRKYISRFLQFLIRCFLGLKISDTQCGLKGFNSRGKEIFLRTEINRYLFDLEFLYLAYKNKELRIVPVEIQLRPDVYFKPLNLQIVFTESINFIKIALRRII